MTCIHTHTRTYIHNYVPTHARNACTFYETTAYEVCFFYYHAGTWDLGTYRIICQQPTLRLACASMQPCHSLCCLYTQNRWIKVDSLSKIRLSEHKWSFCEYGISTKMSYAGPYLFCLYVVLVLRCSVSGRVRGQEMVWIWRGWFWWTFRVILLVWVFSQTIMLIQISLL